MTSDGGRTWNSAALPVADGWSFAMQHVCRDAFSVAARSVDGGRPWVRGSLPEGTGALRDVTVTPRS